MSSITSPHQSPSSRNSTDRSDLIAIIDDALALMDVDTVEDFESRKTQ